MKKILSILFIMFVLLGLLCCFQNTVQADFKYTDILQRADKNTNWNADEEVTSKTREIAANIIFLVQMVGTGTSIIMLTYMGAKYMLAAPSEKADFKKSATGFIVGAVILFAATNIITIISKFATDNIK